MNIYLTILVNVILGFAVLVAAMSLLPAPRHHDNRMDRVARKLGHR